MHRMTFSGGSIGKKRESYKEKVQNFSKLSRIQKTLCDFTRARFGEKDKIYIYICISIVLYCSFLL